MNIQLNPPTCISAEDYEELYYSINYDEDEHDVYSPSSADELRSYIATLVDDLFLAHNQQDATEVADALTDDYINNQTY